MGNIIRVGIADMNICEAPDKITTIGLGSCIGIVLYDGITKKAGLVHIMLPDSTKITQNQNRLKFADTGIALLIDDMTKHGAVRPRLMAKIAGGATMFGFATSSDVGSIGDKNILAVRRKLMACRIPIVAEDVGLNYGRTIVFDPETHELEISAAGKPKKII